LRYAHIRSLSGFVVMPIYAYKCSACGHAEDVMQKMSATPLTTCPKCGAESFSKQVTAPSFALKGSGWYVTDFRDGKKTGGAATTAESTAAADGASKSSDATTAPAAGAAAASTTPAPTAAPAATPSTAAASESKPAPHVHTPNCAH
jgi:putative FmdB family regulatory protein